MIHRRSKWKKCAAAIVLVFSLAGAAFLGILMWRELADRKTGIDFYLGLTDRYVPGTIVQPIEDGRSAETAQPEKSGQVTESGTGKEPDSVWQEWFQNIREECKDVAGWIYLEDSRINYPVVQGEDNEFYLHHLADGTKNSAGSIMMDVQCDPGWEDPMTILHGHHMKNGTMFGELEKYGDRDYWEKHRTMELFTPEGRFRVEIVAAGQVDGNSFSYTSSFKTEAEREKMVEQICQASSFQAEISIDPQDKLLLLSTCAYSYKNARFVVIGKITPFH